MIVKDEAEVIERCLASVKPLIDYWVIVDTGSSDGTQEVIREFMKDVPGELYERPWVDFAHNRNEALDLAQDKADYLLFIDADDLLEYDADFVKPELFLDGYSLPIYYNGTLYWRTQLVKTSDHWRWVGAVHEVIVGYGTGPIEALPGVRMVIIGGGGSTYDPQKYEKHVALLEKALQEDPNSTRTAFYLAQSYKDAQQYEQALAMYEQRVQMGGWWDEERFISLYQIGNLHQQLEHSQEEISLSYADAFTFRSVRAEPLYRLSQYFRLHNNYLLGYLVARLGLEVPQPDDVLFVETWIYDYGLLLEYSISAYWIGRYEEALEASKRLLARRDLPDHVRTCVERNLHFIVEKLPTQFWVNHLMKAHATS